MLPAIVVSAESAMDALTRMSEPFTLLTWGALLIVLSYGLRPRAARELRSAPGRPGRPAPAKSPLTVELSRS